LQIERLGSLGLTSQNKPSLERHHLAMDGTTQNATYDLFDHSIVAVTPVEVVAEFAGEQQASYKITYVDLTTAQLRFQAGVPVNLEGVEIDLAVSLFDQLVNTDRTASAQLSSHESGISWL
jgi:hypothetical protein